VSRDPSDPEEPTIRLSPAPLMAWGSDAVAEVLRRLELPHIALNPGASYRGLHDSLVNYLGNESPGIVLCLHEEHAVAIAHGYAKVSERPMAVALHSNVGLMHATMGLFNAFCDRVPMLVIGATGPLDAALRRPWIDWLHTSADQASLVRQYVKWDDQPGSAAAAVEALVRGHLVTCTYPPGPVYVCLDSTVQESEIDPSLPLPAVERHRPPAPPAPRADDVERVLDSLRGAERPLLLIGRVARDPELWDARVRVAERLGARVLTDLKVGAAFPTRHPLNSAVPGTFLTPSGRELLRQADVVAGLDWVDLGGTLRQAWEGEPVTATVISCSVDHVLHNGWTKDHFELPPVDISLAAHPDLLVSALDSRLAGAEPRPPWTLRAPPAAAGGDGDAITDGIPMRRLASALATALAGVEACLVRLPLGWDGADLDVAHPLDYLGQDGGAGLASGPGMAVGAALALAGTGRLAVAVLGDGDCLMGAPALWSAAHYKLPVLIVVANNRSYFNDEVHQERVAIRRGRPVENRWVGQQMRDPVPDLAGLARSLGFQAYGPVRDEGELGRALGEAVREALQGAAVLVDAHIGTRGYPGGVEGASARPA
jgi:thiamine pyrophosphate-dependent acetolactate synthase large subunit-like protein